MPHQRAILEDAFFSCGLRFLGCVDLDVTSEAEAFESWLQRGWHAGMEFMKRHQNLRLNPQRLLDGARTAMVFALPYQGTRKSSLRLRQSPNWAQPAGYAQYPDYHKGMTKRAELLIGKLRTLQGIDGEDLQARICVDSAPILERALAGKTTRGFIGKNTLYIHPDWGSYLLLGVIIVDKGLKLDSRSQMTPTIRSKAGGCGTCKRCQTHCPTGALDEAYKLNANLCLSYWSIEHRGAVPLRFWPHFKESFLGCDVCQQVCPYNRLEGHTPKLEDAHQSKPFLPKIGAVNLHAVAMMDQASYEAWFGGTPLTRAKRTGLRRNALMAMTVTRHAMLTQTINAFMNCQDEVLRTTAQMANEWLDQNLEV